MPLDSNRLESRRKTEEPLGAIDGLGNQTKKVNISSGLTWTYGYDQANHLKHVERRTTDGGALELSVDYKYDAWGNRVEKSVDADGAGAGAAVATRFAYDGWNPAKGDALGASEFDVWADLDGSSSLTTRYVRGDQVDQLFARLTSSDANRWYLVDHQGSVRNILDNGAASKDALAYDAFGNIVSETNSAERGRYGWISREIDTETGLQYNRARYYDPATGRWISQDPMGFDAGDSNLYRYARNINTNTKEDIVDKKSNENHFQPNPFIEFVVSGNGDTLRNPPNKKILPHIEDLFGITPSKPGTGMNGNDKQSFVAVKNHGKKVLRLLDGDVSVTDDIVAGGFFYMFKFKANTTDDMIQFAHTVTKRDDKVVQDSKIVEGWSMSNGLSERVDAHSSVGAIYLSKKQKKMEFYTEFEVGPGVYNNGTTIKGPLKDQGKKGVKAFYDPTGKYEYIKWTNKDNNRKYSFRFIFDADGGYSLDSGVVGKR